MTVLLSNFSARVYRIVFAAAAVYNIAFGLWAALRPLDFFRVFELDPPRYPAIWACLGMVIGLYGAGYAYAAGRLDRAFPFIAIGLAGKILGPIGWLINVRSGDWPAETFPLIAFNDLIWWAPFTLFLLEGRPVAHFLRRFAPEICAVMHAAAGIGTILLLRGGSEAVPDREQRLAFLAEHSTRWAMGWMLWMAAAVTLLGFYLWWGSRISRRAAFTAFTIGAIGLVCDFAGEAMLIALVLRDFDGITRAASLLMGGAANGLYTIAGIILTLGSPPLHPFLRLWTWAVWASGIALTVFTLAGSSTGTVSSSAILIVLFTPWVVVFGRSLR